MSRGENYMGMSNKEIREHKSELEHDHARRSGEHVSFRTLNRRYLAGKKKTHSGTARQNAIKQKINLK